MKALGQLVDLVAVWLGYNFFISYAHEDGVYARALFEAMRSRGFRLFFDDEEMSAGDVLQPHIRSALRRSRGLIVIASSHSQNSDWVKQELALFRAAKRKRPIIPIDVDGSLRATAWPQLTADLLRIDEQPDRTAPSNEVLSSLEKSFRLRRHNALAVLLLYGIAIALAILAAAVAWSAFRARSEARSLRANVIVARAAQVTDPVIAALLLTELADEEEPFDGATVANSAARQRIPLSVLRGHSGPIVTAAFSTDGRKVLTSGTDGKLVLWTVANVGKPQVLQSSGPPLTAAALDPGGHSVVGCAAGLCRLWELDGATSRALPARPLTFATFSADGAHILAFGGNTAFVFRKSAKSADMRLEHGAPIRVAAFDGSGTRIATAGDDAVIRIWRLGSSEPPVNLRGHRQPVVALAFNPDGTKIASASHDDTAAIWNVDGTGAPVVLHHTQYVNVVKFAPNGQMVATAGYETTPHVWYLNGRPRPLQHGHLNVINDIAFSPDSKWLAAASPDQTASVSTLVSSFGDFSLVGHDADVTVVNFSPDGRRLLTAGDDGTVRIWPLADIPQPKLLRHPSVAITRADIDAAGTHAVTAEGDGAARVWDLRHPSAAPVVLAHRGILRAVFSRDGCRIATTGTDGVVRVWNTDGSEKPLVVFRTKTGPTVAIAFNRTGDRIVVGGGDGTAYLCALTPSPEILQQRHLHTGGIWSARFSDDGARVVTASGDGSAAVWSATSDQEPPVYIAAASGDPTPGAALSPDGTLVALVSFDRTLRVWRIAPRELVVQQRGLEVPVSDVWFLDAHRVVTISNRTARIWDVSSGAAPLVRTSPGPTESPFAALSADSKTLITSGHDMAGGEIDISSFDWKSLTSQLRHATTDCLTPGQRVQYLAESQQEARSASSRCNAAFGR